MKLADAIAQSVADPASVPKGVVASAAAVAKK